MDVNNVLVVGSKGQLGTQLLKFFEQGKCALGDLPKEYENATFTGVDLPEIDITSPLRRFLMTLTQTSS